LQPLEIRTRNERDGQECLGGREHRESAQQRDTVTLEEDEDGAGRAEDRSELGEVSMRHEDSSLSLP
jgi:hypothetical protein